LIAKGSNRWSPRVPFQGRVVREREGERQLSETAFRTARDQASFDIERCEDEKRKPMFSKPIVNWEFSRRQSLETSAGITRENQDTVST